MNDNGHVVPAGESALAPVATPDRFENPGLPPHVHRLADVDPAAAKRAERQVVTLFGLSILSTVLFIVAYFAIDPETNVFVPFMGTVKAMHLVLGLTSAGALFFIGIAAVHWAKTLMPDTEVVEERHELASSDTDRAKAVALLKEGGQAAQLDRRPMLKVAMGGALGVFALPFVVQIVGSLGKKMDKGVVEELKSTIWDIPTEGPKAGKPIRLIRDPLHTPIRADDVHLGEVYHVLPETFLDHEKTDPLEVKAKAAVLMIRLNPNDIKVQKERDWGYQGIVAYSKICTHVGCPVGLYEQQTHHLLCPCHQSTFDITDDCNVIFGPAKRPLPQLKITVDDEGYLVAPQGFKEAVGPSFWSRT